MSSPLSAVFALGQARGTPHLGKKVATRMKWAKGGVICGKAKAEEKRKEQPQNSFTPKRKHTHRDRERKGKGGRPGTMPLQLQVQWLRQCVCE